ncbi:MAG: acyl-CoA thioesterase [Deltaproteobacteria bacterium]|nr:acyl-CoA thioesterase [Deltaproteobacteria bacterium]
MSARFTMPITAVESDIDEVGHVSNIVYVRWVNDVAMEHSRALGWDYAAYKAFGAVFMVRRHEIDYIAQVTLGQTLSAETWVDEWRQASCIRKTELIRDSKVVVRAATTWALISLGSGRPIRIPDEMREKFVA